MTNPEKLEAILASVQVDPGNRGLAKVAGNNLFTATAGDFTAACQSLADQAGLRAMLITGFCIPTAVPPSFETDGPLGTFFLERTIETFGGFTELVAEDPVRHAIHAARRVVGVRERTLLDIPLTHTIAIERVGRAADGKRYTMRGRDITALHDPQHVKTAERHFPGTVSLGIGDGGNEIGMGKIPHETIVANIPNGDLIHCRVPTDHLIVAGVSNWGAYALAAGLFLFKGIEPPTGLFDPDRERAILEAMVEAGPLVDGVTGKATATVDGLSWDEYIRPLVRIREILTS
jgi:D-glutamate cyclase